MMSDDDLTNDLYWSTVAINQKSYIESLQKENEELRSQLDEKMSLPPDLRHVQEIRRLTQENSELKDVIKFWEKEGLIVEGKRLRKEWIFVQGWNQLKKQNLELKEAVKVLLKDLIDLLNAEQYKKTSDYYSKTYSHLIEDEKNA